jgi:hypothetical protein
VYLVGFIFRIYYDARSPESQILFLKFSVVNILSITIIFKFCGEIGTCFLLFSLPQTWLIQRQNSQSFHAAPCNKFMLYICTKFHCPNYSYLSVIAIILKLKKILQPPSYYFTHYTILPYRMLPIISVCIGKGKAISLQAWTGPEGSRKLRLSDFVTTAQDGGRLSVLRTGRIYLPRKYSWYSFLLEAESTAGP